MKKITIAFVIFLISVLFSNSFAGQSLSPTVDWAKLCKAWGIYVAYPSGENAIKVYSILPEHGHVAFVNSSEEHETLDNIFGRDLKMLERQIYSGDRDALRLGFRLMTIADGAYAEDLDIILGAVIRINPKLFLEELKEKGWIACIC